MKYQKIYLGLFLSVFLFSLIPSLEFEEHFNFQYTPHSSPTYSGEIQREWRSKFGGSEDEFGEDVARDTEGFMYVVGSTKSYGSGNRDGFLLKYNSTGDILWERFWGGTGYDNFYALFINDTDIYVAATRSGNIHLVKYNTSGNLLWSSSGGYGNAFCITMDSEGNLYVGGNRDVGGSDEIQFRLIKYNNTGAIIWTKTWGTSRDYEICSSLAIDSSDNVFVVGQSGTTSVNFIYSAKLNSTGDIEWENFWGGSVIEDIGRGIGIDKSDNVFIVGTTGTYAVDGQDMALIKYSNDGDELWYRAYNFVWDDGFGQDIIIEDTGNMFLVGTKMYLEVNSSGGLLYSKNVGRFFALEMDNQGDLYFIGSSYSVGDYQSNFEKWTRTPEIDILSPVPFQQFGNATFEFELSFHMEDIDTSWYSLNYGVNQTFNGTKEVINQDLWNLCDNGSVIVTFYTNNSIGELAYNEIVVLKDTQLNDIILYSPTPLQEFGRISLSFELYIPFSDTDSIWYTINEGSFIMCGLNGTIEQTEWDLLSNGIIYIRFYANNSRNSIISNLIRVIKNVILTPKNVYAIVIGIENYPGTDNDLSFCVDDANGMYNYLRFECNVKEENIYRLLDSSASLSGISGALQQIRNRIRSNDRLFFYYSGHGGNEGGSVEYLCPHDSIPSNPSSLLYDWMLDVELDAINCAEQYIIIDACNSGGIIPEIQGTGRYFMTACRDYEDSIETSELRNGVFTNFFLDSSQYAPDLNSDGILSMEEQFPYVYDETVDYASGYGHNQHPVQNDGIPGPAVLYPGVNSLSLLVQNRSLSYSFNIFGSGHIVTLNFSICSIEPSITLNTIDLIGQGSSATGFGVHSGMIHLESGYNISGYELLIQIDGYNKKTFNWFYGDADGDNLFDIFEIKVSNTSPSKNDTDSDGLDDYTEFNGITDPLLNDTDSDGLDDYTEFNGITNPILNDTDGDGMLDGYEVFNGLDPLNDDSSFDLDMDGLINIIEYTLGTNVTNPDTDGDLMNDGYEYDYGLDLFSDDTGLDPDADGLINIEEYQFNTNPQINDTDYDGLLDGAEINIYGTNPLLSDSDSDGILDGEEINTYTTDPLDEDTDGDGLSDGSEINIHNTNPINEDTDSDSMPDGWEVDYSLNPLINDTMLDPDVDDLVNGLEFLHQTNPQNPDTDSDNWTDGDEVLVHNTDPLDPDDHPNQQTPPDVISGYQIIILIGILSCISSILIKRKIHRLI